MKRRKTIRVRQAPGVAKDIVAECRRLARGFCKLSAVRHHVDVLVVPNESIQTPGGEFSFGCFAWWGSKRKPRLRIGVAAGLAKLVRQQAKCSRSDAVRDVGHVLLHELAHYEQYRDGRPMAERGVNVRAWGLYRRINALTAPGPRDTR
jgi:hypothetical protein